MMARLPDNEADRLEILRQTGLLDSSPEEEFDNLVRLASVICETPMALVTLVDAERQWFKAKTGVPATETSREVAFCAHAILQPEVFVVPDALRDPRFADNPLVTGDPSIRFYAGVPLEGAEGVRVGTLCVIDRAPRDLTQAQHRALILLAEQATRLIKSHRQTQLLEATIARNILIEQELRASQGLFHAFMDNSPFIAFMKDAAGKMVYYNQGCAERFRIDRDAWLGKSETDIWSPEVAAQIRRNDLLVLREWKTLVVEEQWYEADGTAVDWRSYRFPFRDSEGREYVAGFVVDITRDKEVEQVRSYQLALEKANEGLQRLAATDSLTGLRNRRAFDAALEHACEVARRYEQPLTLLLGDIDHFKHFNDAHGHHEGDRILRCVADVLERTLRSSDIVARYGGEEFAVIMPNTPRYAAVESAERLRAAVAKCAGDENLITISIGLAGLEAADWTQADLLKSADEALYQAKREGRNRVCAASPRESLAV